MFLRLHILSGVLWKGVKTMTESTDQYQDLDDWIFAEVEYKPSER